MASDDDDDELVHRAKSGDLLAFNELLGRLRSYARSLANQRLHRQVRLRKDPSDLAQDVVFELFRNFERFDGASMQALRSYVRQILEHNAVDVVRAELSALRRSLAAERSLDAAGDQAGLAARLVAPNTPPLDRVLRNERAEQFLTALEQLPAAQRQAFRLWWENCTFREIAQEMNKTEDAAKSLVRHAKHRLAELVPGAWGDEDDE